MDSFDKIVRFVGVLPDIINLYLSSVERQFLIGFLIFWLLQGIYYYYLVYVVETASEKEISDQPEKFQNIGKRMRTIERNMYFGLFLFFVYLVILYFRFPQDCSEKPPGLPDDYVCASPKNNWWTDPDVLRAARQARDTFGDNVRYINASEEQQRVRIDNILGLRTQRRLESVLPEHQDTSRFGDLSNKILLEGGEVQAVDKIRAYIADPFAKDIQFDEIELNPNSVWHGQVQGSQWINRPYNPSGFSRR